MKSYDVKRNQTIEAFDPLWARTDSSAVDAKRRITMEHFDSNLDLQQQQQQQERRPPIYNAEDYVLGLKKFCKLTGKDCCKKKLSKFG